MIRRVKTWAWECNMPDCAVSFVGRNRERAGRVSRRARQLGWTVDRRTGVRCPSCSMAAAGVPEDERLARSIIAQLDERNDQ